MSIKRLHTNNRMSQIVIHGDTVHIAGQVAWNSKRDSVTEQTNEILGAVESYLEEAGSDKEHILNASVWLSSAEYLAEFNGIWDTWVPEGQAPARACVISELVDPGFFVEVAVVAVKK